jgi:hypothetical protein
MISMARAHRQIFTEQHAERDAIVAVTAGIVCVVVMAVLLILAARL